MTDFVFDRETRTALVAEMQAAAMASGFQTRAIQTLVDWYENGAEGDEPGIENLVSWKMACAISSDLAHIYRKRLPEGTYSSQYSREFLRIKRSNRRRNANYATLYGRNNGPKSLRGMLNL